MIIIKGSRGILEAAGMRIQYVRAAEGGPGG